MPNTDVRWRHALAGGIFVAVGFELAKRGLAWYIGRMPTYSMVYGAFATVPIFLLWLYVGWVIVLLGAVIAAYAPSLSMRIARWPARRDIASSWRWRCCALGRARAAVRAVWACTSWPPAATDPLQVEPRSMQLTAMDWVAVWTKTAARARCC